MIDTACSQCGGTEWEEKMSGRMCVKCRYVRREIGAGMTICKHLVEPYSCGVCFPFSPKGVLSPDTETDESSETCL